MAQTIMNEKVYTIYEKCPEVVTLPKEDICPNYRKKKALHQNRLNMARNNYRKK